MDANDQYVEQILKLLDGVSNSNAHAILRRCQFRLNDKKIGGDFCMPAQWTAKVVGEMHLHGISAKSLAEAVGWNPKYLSAVMNGHKNPKGAEAKLSAALEQLTAAKGTE